MAKPLWNGSISFGLVSIPIELYSSTVDTTVRFHLVTPDGKCRLHQRLVCPETGKEFDFSQTTRAHEVAPGEFVIVSPEELKALRPDSGNTIELESFVLISDIDPIYYERSYYVLPKKGAEKAYALLLQALQKTGRAGLGEFVMREREHLALVRPGAETLLIETLYFPEEIRPAKDLGPPQLPKSSPARELQLAIQLIESRSDAFKPKRYKDDYREQVLALLKKKERKGAIAIEDQSKGAPRNAKVVDIMSRLKKSLADAGRDPGASTGGPTGAPKAAKTRKKAGTKSDSNKRRSRPIPKAS